MHLTLPNLAVLAFLSAAASAAPCNVHVQFRHSFGSADLPFEDVSLVTLNGSGAGNTISVTRLSYLVSHAALLRADGSREGLSQVAAINQLEERTSLDIAAVAPGTYEGLTFDIGLDAETNHADPAQYEALHPLNPQLNGLHWGWQGGYVFLAIEGRYVLPADTLGGYSYHIGTDAHRMTVMLAQHFKIAADSVLDVDFDVARVFDGLSKITIQSRDGGDSTHSGPGDILAAHLATNITSAFKFVRVAAATVQGVPPSPSAAPTPAGTTPFTLNIPKHFPKPQLPRDNPLTQEGIALGERLFLDSILSKDNSQSCAACHHTNMAFAEHRPVSLGAAGDPVRRNSMPLFNLAWSKSMTWDGKRARIRDQALAPIQDAGEMNQSLADTVRKLEADPTYPAQFARVFGSPGITSERLSLAMEQFLLTIISADSKFDRVLTKQATFSEEEERGLKLFLSEYDPARNVFGGDCFHCHGGNLFTDHDFHNNGLAPDPKDRGRSEVTLKSQDAGKFKTPSLRNVALTGPYMHDGRFATLEEVLDHYSDHVVRTDTLDPNIAKHPSGGVQLSSADKKAIISFLKTLTDSRWQDQVPTEK